jgi:hypothetical protein
MTRRRWFRPATSRSRSSTCSSRSRRSAPVRPGSRGLPRLSWSRAAQSSRFRRPEGRCFRSRRRPHLRSLLHPSRRSPTWSRRPHRRKSSRSLPKPRARPHRSRARRRLLPRLPPKRAQPQHPRPLPPGSPHLLNRPKVLRPRQRRRSRAGSFSSVVTRSQNASLHSPGNGPWHHAGSPTAVSGRPKTCAILTYTSLWFRFPPSMRLPGRRPPPNLPPTMKGELCAS